MTPPVDTIAAVATPPGRGGIGIIRISGPLAADIAHTITGRKPPPRHAVLADFIGVDGEVVDQGIVLSFPGPHSFTGEDVVELQGHGGPVVLDMLLEHILRLGARQARPGEFSERAFLNDRLDLTQAEAIADLVDSESRAAVRLASRSLHGVFSTRVNDLLSQVVDLRVFVEAAIDFPEEEIDFLSDGKVQADLDVLIQATRDLLASAHTGQLVRDGMRIVLAGPPNAGKSSLLNALSGRDSAIVTDQPGTTRDVLREHINIDGMPLHIIDTAGLRESSDIVEQEGIRRTRAALADADHVLWLFDSTQGLPDPEYDAVPGGPSLTLVENKIDLTGRQPGRLPIEGHPHLCLSLKTGAGLEELRSHLKATMAYEGSHEGDFIARRRHLDALQRMLDSLQAGRSVLQESRAGELLAEDLRVCQSALSEITGEFTPDALLGEIFSSFCIGK